MTIHKFVLIYLYVSINFKNTLLQTYYNTIIMCLKILRPSVIISAVILHKANNSIFK